ARQLCSAALDSKQNERDRLRVAEGRQQETGDQHQAQLPVQQSHDYNRFTLRREMKGICCAAGKIKVSQLGEPPEPLKTLLAGYTADLKHFLSVIRKYNS
ncbi:unnamed protein product, partial [Onchocerca ochengi]